MGRLVERCRRLSEREGAALPVWAAVADQVAPVAVSRVLLEGLAVHAVRRYDLAEVARCLGEMASLGLGETVTFQEAVEFLLNQQVDCGAIGTPFVERENLLRPAAREVTGPLLGCLASAHGCLAAAPGR